MANLILTVPDGDECIGCNYRNRRTDIKEEGCHCAIFMSRADKKKTKACLDNSTRANSDIKI